jgi:hypothetical protein
VRQVDQRDRDHRIHQTRPEHRHQHESQKQRRKGQDNIHDAHDDRIGAAAEIAGDQADENAGDDRKRHDDKADEQRETGAVDQTG